MARLPRNPLILSKPDTERLKECVARDVPDFAGRMESAYQLDEIEQGYFDEHTILEITSAAPLPDRAIHVAWHFGTPHMYALTYHLDHLNDKVLEIETVSKLDRADVAEDYALNVNGWTSESPLRDFRVNAFSDIPWNANLAEGERATIEALRARLGERIGPMDRRREGQATVFHFWVLNDRRLTERTLTVRRGGRLERTDVVHGEQLFVPAGTFWKMAGGRAIPAG